MPRPIHILKNFALEEIEPNVEEQLDTLRQEIEASQIIQDMEILGKAEASDVYGKAAIDTFLSEKADADSVYQKTQMDILLSEKIDVPAVATGTKALYDDLVWRENTSYTKSEVDVFVNAKLSKGSTTYVTAKQIEDDINDRYTKAEVDALQTTQEDRLDYLESVAVIIDNIVAGESIQAVNKLVANATLTDFLSDTNIPQGGNGYSAAVGLAYISSAIVTEIGEIPFQITFKITNTTPNAKTLLPLGEDALLTINKDNGVIRYTCELLNLDKVYRIKESQQIWKEITMVQI